MSSLATSVACSGSGSGAVAAGAACP